MKSKKIKALQIIVSSVVASTMLVQFGGVAALAGEDKTTGDKVELQMYNRDTANNAGSLTPQYKMVNTSDKEINLSKVKIRYYFTIDNENDINYFCDYACKNDSDGYAGLTSTVSGKIVKMDDTMEGADHYLELTFSKEAGSLQPGGSIELSNRFSKADWSAFTQSNDYSFNSSNSSYADWDKSVVLIDDEVVSGTEPNNKVVIEIKTNVNVTVKNNDTSEKASTMNPVFQVENTGNQDINLADLKLRYYFTDDNDINDNFVCDYACVEGSAYRALTDNVIGNFGKMKEVKDKADTYLEVGFKDATGTLKPGEKMTINTRIFKDDWSAFTQSNDFSFNDSSKVTANYQGNDIAGQAPGKVIVIIKDSQLLSKEVSYDLSYPEDKKIDMVLNGNKFTGITFSDKQLEEGKDYKVSGSTVTLLQDFLSSFEEGTSNTLTFNFNQGASQDLVLNVSKTKIKSKMNITIGNVLGNPGETVKVPITIKGVNKNGVYGYNFKLKYDASKFENVSIVPGEDAINPTKTFLADVDSEKGKLFVTYCDTTDNNSESLTEDGTICYINMTIRKDAKAGKSDISLVDPGDFVDDSVNTYETYYTNGSVTVKAPVINDSELTTPNIDVDLNNVTDKEVPIKLNGNKLVSIKNGDKTLELGKDYTYDEAASTVTLLKDYLGTLSKGETDLTFNFSSGNDQTLKVNVTKAEKIMTVDIASAKAKQGTTVKIPVILKDVISEGLYGYSFTLQYDPKVFENVKVEAGEDSINPKSTFFGGVNTDSHNIHFYYASSKLDDSETIFKDGVLAYITLDVKSDAPIGDSALKLVDEGEFMDSNVNFYEKQFNNSVITVEKADEKIEDSKLNTTEMSFYEGKADERYVGVSYNGNTLSNIKNGDYELVKDKDYEVDENGVSLLKDYLNSLVKGEYKLTFNFNAGNPQNIKVTVLDDQSQEAKISIDNVIAKAGETVSIPVRIKDIPKVGAACGAFMVGYDPSLVEVESITPGDAIVNPDSNFTGYNNTENNTLYLEYIDYEATGKELLKDDGVYAYINLKVLDNVTPQVIKLDLASGSRNILCDYDVNDIPFKFEAGSITIK